MSNEKKTKPKKTKTAAKKTCTDVVMSRTKSVQDYDVLYSGGKVERTAPLKNTIELCTMENGIILTYVYGEDGEIVTDLSFEENAYICMILARHTITKYASYAPQITDDLLRGLSVTTPTDIADKYVDKIIALNDEISRLRCEIDNLKNSNNPKTEDLVNLDEMDKIKNLIGKFDSSKFPISKIFNLE